MEEGIRYPVLCMSVPRIICMVEISLPFRVEIILFQDVTVISDLDSRMDHVSVGLD